jgi:hypothetical protein
MSNKTSTSTCRDRNSSSELSAQSKPVPSNSQQEVLLSPSLLVMQQPQTTPPTTVSKPQPTHSEKTQENQQELLPTTPTTPMVSLSHKINTNTGRNNQSQQSSPVQTKHQQLLLVNQRQPEKQMVQVVHVLRHSHDKQRYSYRSRTTRNRSMVSRYPK